MADLIERFVADQRERGRTRNTIDLRLRQLRLYEREFGPLSDATEQSIQDWLASRKTRAGTPLTAKTVNAYLVTFSVFFEWASEQGAVKANPITGIQRPTGDSEPAPPISDEDLARAIEAARNPIRCMIVLGAYAGLAPQEIAFIDRGDVDDASEQPSLKVTHGKAGRVRSVPLVAEALQALNDLPMPERGRLFPTARASSVSQRINRHLHGLGIESTANSLQAWFGFEELRNSERYLRARGAIGQRNVGRVGSPTEDAMKQLDQENSGDGNLPTPLEAPMRLIDVQGVSDHELEVPNDLEERLISHTAGLLVSPELLQQCAAALVTGSIVLQGPPGTGKSTLARALAKAFSADLLTVTAHEDWSTFEVMGRQELRVDENGREEITAVDGHFTEAVLRCGASISRHLVNNSGDQATWLLIDELNRAHPDKSFGELLSVLGSDDLVKVTLGYRRGSDNVLVVPRRFRIIATINSIDKQFVNGLSQGLRRRFTFLTVDVPPRRAEGEAWGQGTSLASREFDLVGRIAALRVARRLGADVTTLSGFLATPAVRSVLEELFVTVERVRYATESDLSPFLAVGTAPLIDTVELFLVRAQRSGLDSATAAEHIDWATSVRVAPLFDAGGINRDKLVYHATGLPPSLSRLTRRALLEIASDGQFYI